jgi:ATP-dependent helicase/nuclease subunit A
VAAGSGIDAFDSLPAASGSAQPAGTTLIQQGLFDAPPPEPPRRPAVMPDIQIVDVHRDDGFGGARFGELVHAVLASVALDADRAAVAGLTELHARILSASGEEAAAAAGRVAHVLAHDLLARARAAASRGACRRETPVTASLSDGTLLEGIVDLAFEEDGAWTVIDYKTDREIAAAGDDRYRRQVAVYAAAVSQATGRPATGALIRI